jgi:hypothetical protein
MLCSRSEFWVRHEKEVLQMTQRDIDKANGICVKWFTEKVDLANLIAQALHQARLEGREEMKP